VRLDVIEIEIAIEIDCDTDFDFDFDVQTNAQPIFDIKDNRSTL